MPTTDTSGTTICWEEAGSGDPLLLIMGATFPRQMWGRVVEGLRPHRRVIWYDNRGFGDSGRPPRPYRVEDMTADALAVLDAAGVDQADVYGVSMGGVVAQHLALTARPRVRSLVLGCTWAPGPDKRRASWSSELRYRLPQNLLLRLSVPLLYGPRRVKDKVRQDLEILRRIPIDADSLRGQAEAIMAYSKSPRAGRVTVPTLVLHGDRDRVVPLAWGRELAGGIPFAKLVVLPGAGHNYITDAEDDANREVLTFLDQVSQSQISR